MAAAGLRQFALWGEASLRARSRHGWAVQGREVSRGERRNEKGRVQLGWGGRRCGQSVGKGEGGAGGVAAKRLKGPPHQPGQGEARRVGWRVDPSFSCRPSRKLRARRVRRAAAGRRVTLSRRQDTAATEAHAVPAGLSGAAVPSPPGLRRALGVLPASLLEGLPCAGQTCWPQRRGGLGGVWLGEGPRSLELRVWCWGWGSPKKCRSLKSTWGQETGGDGAAPEVHTGEFVPPP